MASPPGDARCRTSRDFFVGGTDPAGHRDPARPGRWHRRRRRPRLVRRGQPPHAHRDGVAGREPGPRRPPARPPRSPAPRRATSSPAWRTATRCSATTTRALAQVPAGGTGPARRAIAVFDIDRFTTLVDGSGLDVADDVVRQLATRLRAAADAGDVVARTGRHEFAVLFAGETREDAATTTARTLATVFDVPVTIGEPRAVRHLLDRRRRGRPGPGDRRGAAARRAGGGRAPRRLPAASRIVTSDHALRAHTADQARLEVELRDAVRDQRPASPTSRCSRSAATPPHDHVVAVEALARWTRARTAPSSRRGGSSRSPTSSGSASRSACGSSTRPSTASSPGGTPGTPSSRCGSTSPRASSSTPSSPTWCRRGWRRGRSRRSR